MKQQSSSRRKRNSTKSVLRLVDLELAKAAVLNSLYSADAKRGCRPLDRISGIRSALDVGECEVSQRYFFVRAGLRAGEDP